MLETDVSVSKHSLINRLRAPWTLLVRFGFAHLCVNNAISVLDNWRRNDETNCTNCTHSQSACLIQVHTLVGNISNVWCWTIGYLHRFHSEGGIRLYSVTQFYEPWHLYTYIVSWNVYWLMAAHGYTGICRNLKCAVGLRSLRNCVFIVHFLHGAEFIFHMYNLSLSKFFDNQIWGALVKLVKMNQSLSSHQIFLNFKYCYCAIVQAFIMLM